MDEDNAFDALQAEREAHLDAWLDAWEDAQVWRDLLFGEDGNDRHAHGWRRALVSERSGPAGRAAAGAAPGWVAVECRSRHSLPEWLRAAVRRAEGAANAFVTPRLPLVVLQHEDGGRHVDDLVIIPRSAFLAWFGDWRGRGDGDCPQDTASGA